LVLRQKRTEAGQTPINPAWNQTDNVVLTGDCNLVSFSSVISRHEGLCLLKQRYDIFCINLNMAIHCPKYEWMLDMEVGCVLSRVPDYPGKGIMAQHHNSTWAELDTDETFTQVYPSQDLCPSGRFSSVLPIPEAHPFGVAEILRLTVNNNTWCRTDQGYEVISKALYNITATITQRNIM